MTMPTEFIRIIPYVLQLVVWIIALVAAIWMLRKGGAAAERIFLIGVALAIFSLLIMLTTVIVIVNTVASPDTVSVLSSISIIREVTYLWGIIFIIFAFWIKFKAGR